MRWQFKTEVAAGLDMSGLHYVERKVTTVANHDRPSDRLRETHKGVISLRKEAGGGLRTASHMRE